MAAGARDRLGAPAAHLPVVRHRRSGRPRDARHAPHRAATSRCDRSNVLAIDDPRADAPRRGAGALAGRRADATSVRAGTRWQILGQQVMFAPQSIAGADAGNPDSWDGYRAVALACLRHGGAPQGAQPRRAHRRRAQLVGLRPAPAVPTRATTRRRGRGSLGVEIVCPAVSSPSRFQGPEGEARLAEHAEGAPAPASSSTAAHAATS